MKISLNNVSACTFKSMEEALVVQHARIRELEMKFLLLQLHILDELILDEFLEKFGSETLFKSIKKNYEDDLFLYDISDEFLMDVLKEREAMLHDQN